MPRWRRRSVWFRSSVATIRASSRWWPSAVLAACTPANWQKRSAFRASLFPHRRAPRRGSGYSYAERGGDVVTLAPGAAIKSPQPNLPPGRWGAAFPSATLRTGPGRPGRAGGLRPERAPVFFGGKGLPATIYPRASLQIGKKYPGPAVVTEYSATTVVLPARRFWPDRAGNLVIKTQSSARPEARRVARTTATIPP